MRAGRPPVFGNWWIAFGPVELHASRVGVWFYTQPQGGGQRMTGIVFWPPRVHGHLISARTLAQVREPYDINRPVEPSVYWSFPRYPVSRPRVAWLVMMAVTVLAIVLCWQLYRVANDLVHRAPAHEAGVTKN